MTEPVLSQTQLVEQWREIADEWQKQLNRERLSHSPVGGGRNNIQNWINWLRSCAGQLESAIRAEQKVNV